MTKTPTFPMRTNLDGGARLVTAKATPTDGSTLYQSRFFGGWPSNCRNTDWFSEADAIAGHARLVEQAGSAPA